MTALDTAPPPQAARLAGKYTTFELGGETYGLPVRQVLEIIRCIDITRVPNMPPHVRGVTNLRGRIVPVLDLRLKFALADSAIDGKTCTIVIQEIAASGSPTTIGIMVDKVSEVVLVHENQIEQPADYGGCVDAASVLAVARIENDIASLLDLSHVLRDELSQS